MSILASFRHKNKEENIFVSKAIMNIYQSSTLRERIYYGHYFVEYKLENYNLSEEEKRILIRKAGYSYSSFERTEEPEIRPIKEEEIQDYIYKGQTIDMCLNLYEHMDEEQKRVFRPINMNCCISLLEKNEIAIYADKGMTYIPAFLKEILDVDFDSFNFQSLYIKWKGDSSEDHIEAYGLCDDGWRSYTTVCPLYKGIPLHKYVYLTIGYYLICAKNPYKICNRYFYRNKNIHCLYTY